MTDESDNEPVAKPEKNNSAKDPANRQSNAVWVAAAAGMGIGSAALVAALMYANRGKGFKGSKKPD